MEHRAAATDPVILSRILAPVTTLGPGRRLGIWVQGCALACAGCASLDTWDLTLGTKVSVADLAYRIESLLTTESLDGITVTGGEPTDQALELVASLERLKDRPDLLLFTGRAYEAARAVAAPLLEMASCVVAGPYRAAEPPATPLRRLVASGNQTLHFSDAATEQRYRAWAAAPDADLQVLADDRDLFLVGLPAAGDLDRFRNRLVDRGVRLEGVTWRA